MEAQLEKPGFQVGPSAEVRRAAVSEHNVGAIHNATGLGGGGPVRLGLEVILGFKPQPCHLLAMGPCRELLRALDEAYE